MRTMKVRFRRAVSLLLAVCLLVVMVLREGYVEEPSDGTDTASFITQDGLSEGENNVISTEKDMTIAASEGVSLHNPRDLSYFSEGLEPDWTFSQLGQKMIPSLESDGETLDSSAFDVPVSGEIAPEGETILKEDILNKEEAKASEEVVDAKPDAGTEQQAQFAATMPSSGAIAGTNITFTLSNGYLTLSGSGTLSLSPFHDYRDSITGVRIGSGIVIGESAFYDMTRLNNVTIDAGVAAIGATAFNNCTALVSVSIPSTVKTIGIGAFAFCTSLSSVSMAGGVTALEERAFCGCSALRTIALPSTLNTIGWGAFALCTGLTNVTVPVTNVGDYAFYGCTGLTEATLTERVRTVGEYAFADISALKTVKLSNGLQTIGVQCFVNCTGLTSFGLPDTVTSVGDYAFGNCSSMKDFKFSSDMNEVELGTFYNCSALQSIVLPNSITSIGAESFYNCASLSSVQFPTGYTDVGAYAFSFCNQVKKISETVCLGNIGDEAFINTSFLGSIRFSSSVTTIGVAAFQGNSNLAAVDFQNATLAVESHAFFDCPKLSTVKNEPKYTKVGEAAFHSCQGISGVVLANNCAVIDAGAFLACGNLSDIDFAGASVSVEGAAFAQCASLQGISGEEKVVNIGDNGFYECTKLTDVSGFTSVAKIGKFAFMGCSSLTAAVIPDTVSEIPDGLFDNCTSLQSVSLPSGLTSIGSWAFFNCESLLGCSLPSTVSQIGQCAFTHCSKLREVTIPSGVETIEMGTWGECDSLRSVTISDSVKTVADWAFAQCDSLQYVYGGEKVSSIGERAFSFCESMVSTVFTNELTDLGDIAFYGCTNLSSVGDISNAQNIGKSCFWGCKNLSGEIALKNAEAIGDYAFKGCEKITSVRIPSATAQLSVGAFLDCTALAAVQLDAGLTEIGEEVFANCISLEKITVPATVTILGNRAFYGCKALSQVTLHNGLSSIGDGTFYQCSSLASMAVPDTVKTIGYSAFNRCTNLVSVTLPGALEDIAEGLFYECTSLSNIALPETVHEIGYASFYHCADLKRIVFPEKLSRIGEYAFSHCEGLDSVSIPDNVVSVSDCAFAYCTALADAILPKSLVTVGNYQFYGCSALSSVICRGEIIGIGTGAFYGCGSLADVTLLSGIPAVIGDSAFSGTPSDLVLHHSPVVKGWTTPSWVGPDKNTYHTESFEADVTGNCGNGTVWTYYIDSGTLVISGNGFMSDYDSEIDTPWYAYKKEIYTVRIEEGVRSVGSRAFSGCTALRNVHMADSVEACGDYAFSKCDNLYSVQLSDSLREIGAYQFYNCASLHDMVIPGSLKTIGSYAFFNCTNLENIVLPGNINFIGEGCFYHCSGLAEVIWPSAMEAIPDYAFTGCFGLTTVAITDKTKTIGKSAFSNCASLQSVYIAGSGEQIGNYAFYGCENLTAVFFAGEKPSRLGYLSFGNTNGNLRLNHAGQWSETSLKSEDGADILCAAYAPASGSCGGSIRWAYLEELGLLHVSGTGAMEDYALTEAPWRQYSGTISNVIVDDGVTSIGENAFYQCSSLREVVLPDSVASIGAQAFADCDGIVSVYLPATLASLGKAAFYHCSSLRLVELPEELTEISDYVFALCTSLRKVHVGEAVSKIGYSAFYACESLSNLSLPANLARIEPWAFARCASLSGLNLGSATRSIGDYCFFGCTALKTLDLQNVQEIGRFAFCGIAVNQVNIPSATTAVGAFAFGNCGELTEITVASGNADFVSEGGVLYNAARDTLYQYPAGKTNGVFQVPSGTVTIAEGAFYGCQIELVRIPDGVKTLQTAAFAACPKLVSVDVPESVTSVAEGVFYGCPALDAVDVALIKDEMSFDSVTGTLAGHFTILNDTDQEENVIFMAAAYQNGKMLTSSKSSGFVEAGETLHAEFQATGGLSKDVEFKVFLLREGSYEPFADNLTIPCSYSAPGTCTLKVSMNGEAQMSAYASAKDLSMQSETADGISATFAIPVSDYENMMLGAETGRLSGFDSKISLVRTEDGEPLDSAEDSYTTNVDIANYDMANGYVGSGIPVQDAGLTLASTSEGQVWLIPPGVDLAHNSGMLVAADGDNALSAVGVGISEDGTNRMQFSYQNEEMFAVKGIGYYAILGDPVVQKNTDGSYTVIVPEKGRNLLFDIQPLALVNAIQSAAAAKQMDCSGITDYTVSLVTTRQSQIADTVLQLTIATDGNAVIGVSAASRVNHSVDAEDKTYHALRYENSAAATQDMVLSVADVSPAQGAKGQVTVQVNGTCMEASASVALSNGSSKIDAQKIYYYDHTKLYATFDLTDAPDGMYDVVLTQKGTSVTCAGSFKVDGSLPKGQLASSINVDKSAKPGTVYKGSVTFSNTGYTDVYAPVIHINGDSFEAKDDHDDGYSAKKTLFVSNAEGLPGIIANGQTAAYNFDYKITGSNGYSVSVYNYADITENIAELPEISEKSTVSDIQSYNLLQLTGTRACDYAESMAKMACVLGALGDDNFNVDYLQNAYLASAQGTLIGDTLVSAADLSSRDLSLARYYYTDITTHQDDGIFGLGWHTDFDVTAKYNAADKSGGANIVITSGSGMSVYTQKDGVFKEAVYGLSTASITDGAISVDYQDGSAISFRADGKLNQTADVYGNTITCEYNADGKLAAIASSEGDRLQLVYENGHVVRAESALTGNSAEYTYMDGMLQTAQNSYGAVSYEYDSLHFDGRKNALTKVTSHTGVDIQYSYDELGRVVAVNNGEAIMTYEYAGLNELCATDAMGNHTDLCFNAAGYLARTIDARGNMSEQSYSDYLLSSGNSFGLFTNYKYNYDDKFNLTSVTDASGKSVNYSYDGRGNVASVTDRRGITTGYERNNFGATQRLVYADGKYENYEYDAKGNIVAATKRDGTGITYAYDKYSQLTSVSFSTDETIAYEYDGKGNLTQIDENGKKTTLEYNDRGDVTKINYPSRKSVAYTYDASGNVSSTTAVYGQSSNTTYYVYDNYGRLQSANFGGADLVSYEYNADGSLKKQQNYNGTYTEYDYTAGMLSAIRNCKADGTVMSSFQYTYDELGQLITMTDKSGTWNYSYDDLGQLICAKSPEGIETEYSYDLSGNRISKASGGSYENYNANELNQYTSYGSATRNYDDNGNLISQTDEHGTTTYDYDYQDRLIRVTEPDGTITQYGYDAFGGREGVAVGTPNAEGTDLDIVSTEYLNSPFGDGCAIAAYRDNKASFLLQGNGLAAWYRVKGEGTELYTYAYNHLGSTTEITDLSGNIVNSYTYDQEGKVIASTEGVDNPFTYVGRYGIADDGNGLYYARARYISADTMSFISADPIGQGSDLNLYRYANNNFVSFVDINGKEWSPVSEIGMLGAAYCNAYGFECDEYDCISIGLDLLRPLEEAAHAGIMACGILWGSTLLFVSGLVLAEAGAASALIELGTIVSQRITASIVTAGLSFASRFTTIGKNVDISLKAYYSVVNYVGSSTLPEVSGLAEFFYGFCLGKVFDSGYVPPMSTPTTFLGAGSEVVMAGWAIYDQLNPSYDAPKINSETGVIKLKGGITLTRWDKLWQNISNWFHSWWPW